jgi:cytochrome c oxidase cbb3-type subunit III
MKKIFILVFGMLVGFETLAQQSASIKDFWADPINHPMMPLYTVTSFVFFVIVLVLLVAIYLVRILDLLVKQSEKDRAKKLGIVYAPKPSWWEKMWQSANNFVPLAQEKDIELNHSYDGIKELDNHLPPWWKWLFYGTIIWGAVYLVVYHVSSTMPLQIAEYQSEVEDAAEEVRKLRASQPLQAIDENALTFSSDAEIINKGKSVFTGNNCASCHRIDGGGNTIGPNLTDNYWLHGGEIKNIFGTIKNGVVEKGMPAWGKLMSPQEVRDVTFYVMSLQGTNPLNGKAPQGNLFKPITQDSLNIKSDSTRRQASL